MSEYTLHLGDCRDVLPTLAPDSIDAIVTDPPYELAFMGAAWDKTGIANDVSMWREALRVAKPGALLLAFAATRTYHRMACAIEDAGWVARDMIMWHHGQGFPKGHEQLKPASEPLMLARKGAGVGNLQIDACRIGTESVGWAASPSNGFSGGLGNNEPGGRPVAGRWPTNVVFSHADGCELLGTKRVLGAQGGRIKTRSGKHNGYGGGYGAQDSGPNYIDADGTEEVAHWRCVDGCPVAELDRQSGISVSAMRHGKRAGKSTGRFGAFAGQDNVAMGHDDAGGASRFFYVAKPSRAERDSGLGRYPLSDGPTMGSGIGGQPDQLLPNNRNPHPTVKPVELMRYLVRLVTPPDGTVLDMFLGSGTTGAAALSEGFHFVGIEQDATYLEIARERLRALGVRQHSIFDSVAI